MGVEVDMTIWWAASVTTPLKNPGYAPAGYKYIWTIVDYATRYPEAITLRTKNAKTVAETLIQYFSRMGIPDEIVPDQGFNFMSKLLAQLYYKLQVTRSR